MSTTLYTPILRRGMLALAAIGLVALSTGCASVSKPVPVSDTLAKTPALSTLNGLVASAGLADTLKGTGPYTVFAPSDDAFKALPAKTQDELRSNPARLKAVLAYHVVNGKMMAADVRNSKVKSLNGADLELSKAGDFVTVESAAVTRADIVATNGVVHVVDTVLLPPAAK